MSAELNTLKRIETLLRLILKSKYQTYDDIEKSEKEVKG